MGIFNDNTVLEFIQWFLPLAAGIDWNNNTRLTRWDEILRFWSHLVKLHAHSLPITSYSWINYVVKCWVSTSCRSIQREKWHWLASGTMKCIRRVVASNVRLAIQKKHQVAKMHKNNRLFCPICIAGEINFIRFYMSRCAVSSSWDDMRILSCTWLEHGGVRTKHF